MASTPSGRGYWLAGGNGAVLAFGNAQYYGSLSSAPLNQPIVGIICNSAPRAQQWERIGCSRGLVAALFRLVMSAVEPRRAFPSEVHHA